MPSDVEIVNAGLVQLGEARIHALTDTTKAAREAAAIYAIERDAELESHLWKFATKLASLPSLAAPFGPAVTTQFRLLYNLPDDFLRLEIAGDLFPGASFTDYRNAPDADYQINSNQIATNLGPPLNIRYVARVVDTTEYPPTFVKALAMRMAMSLAPTLTQSTAKQQAAAAGYGMAITQAVESNAIQRPPDAIADSPWILSRYT